jgi:hypothetical protein
MDEDLVARINAYWKKLNPFRGKGVKDYEHEIIEAKNNKLSILYESGGNLVLIKEIQSYHAINNAVTALQQSGILGTHVLITGKGHRYVREPKTDKEKIDSINSELTDIRHPLIVTNSEHPPLLASDYNTLLGSYKALIVQGKIPL